MVAPLYGMMQQNEWTPAGDSPAPHTITLQLPIDVDNKQRNNLQSKHGDVL